MSKAASLLKSLLVAADGVSASERQAQARVRTNDYFDFDRKEMKAEGLMAGVKEIEAEVQALRDAASAAGNTVMVEIYDASLTVFVKWVGIQDAA